MARTNRRREPREVINPNRGTKKNQRRAGRKSTKKKLQEIDFQDPGAWDDYDDYEEENIVRGND